MPPSIGWIARDFPGAAHAGSSGGEPIGEPGGVAEQGGGVVELAEVAESLGVSYDLYRKRFVRVIRDPPSLYRSRRRIARAGELMRTTSTTDQTTDQQVAGHPGFSDPQYFSSGSSS